jgi:Dockerin type I domain
LTTIAGSIGTASPAIQLYKYDLNGDASSKAAVPLAGVTASVIDHAIELDFGTAGLGGNASTTTADGYYELDVTVGTTTYKHFFYRLLGDVNGDGVVDNNDLTDIATELAQSSPTGYTPLSADVNGDGSVTAMDTTLATRAKGHKLGTGLPLG